MIPSSVWTPAGVIVAALGAAGGFAIWGAKLLRRFIAWFRNEARIQQIEATMATKTQVEQLGTELRAADVAHQERDAFAFAAINTELGKVRDQMAKGADVIRLEGKVDQLLINHFDGTRRP